MAAKRDRRDWPDAVHIEEQDFPIGCDGKSAAIRGEGECPAVVLQGHRLDRRASDVLQSKQLVVRGPGSNSAIGQSNYTANPVHNVEVKPSRST